MLAAAGSQLSTQNYTAQQANLTLAQASGYIQEINQSAYLFFYPNLTAAYSYLNRANELVNTSPSLSVTYAELATTSATSAYYQISLYRRYALLITLFLTAWVGAFLYFLMKPSIKSKPTPKPKKR